MSDDDAIFGLGLVLVGIVLIIYGIIILVVIWAVVSAVVGFVQYRKYLKAAEEEFDEVAEELGVDLPVDDVLEAVMGIEVLEGAGFETVADWMVGTPLGITEEWEN